MSMDKKPQTVDEYIEQVPSQTRAMAKQLRAIILAAAPNATEKIGYRMPYYSYHGRLIYFGAYETYIGLYVMSARDTLKDEIKPYKAAKATLHFPVSDPLPAALVEKIVKTQVALNEGKAV